MPFYTATDFTEEDTQSREQSLKEIRKRRKDEKEIMTLPLLPLPRNSHGMHNGCSHHNIT
jgi:hypothetical protein